MGEEKRYFNRLHLRSGEVGAATRDQRDSTQWNTEMAGTEKELIPEMDEEGI